MSVLTLQYILHSGDKYTTLLPSKEIYQTVKSAPIPTFPFIQNIYEIYSTEHQMESPPPPPSLQVSTQLLFQLSSSPSPIITTTPTSQLPSKPHPFIPSYPLPILPLLLIPLFPPILLHPVSSLFLITSRH